MINVKLILFDLDNTLLYFNDYWESSVKYTFRKLKIIKSICVDDLFHVYVDKDKEHEDLFLKKQLKIDEYRKLRSIRTLEEFGIHIDDKTAIEIENNIMKNYKLFIKPNVIIENILIELKRKYFLGIVSNGTSSFQYEKIDSLGWNHIFPKENIFISEEVGYEKPDYQIYEIALKKFDVLPSETLFIGDNWNNDVVGPTTIGIKSIWLNMNNDKIPKKNIAYGIIHIFQEIKKYIE